MEPPVESNGPDEREERVRLIAESAAALLKDERARARSRRFKSLCVDQDKWREFTDAGWLSLRLAEQEGGLGMGVSELCTIAQAVGAGLTPEPIAQAALALPLLPARRREAVMAGEQLVLPGFAAAGTPAPHIERGRLSGMCEAVPLGGCADLFLVEVEGGAALVGAMEEGLTLVANETHDGNHLAVLRFADCACEPVETDMARLREEAALVLSAQLLGIADKAFELTLDYLRQRNQFGKPIGSFQALQHRAVDLSLELSLLRAAVEAAAAAFDDGAERQDIARLVSIAKARASRAVHAITQASIQFFGGIGYTDEADIGLYLRKAMTLAGLLGTERQHRERLLALVGAAA
jgi:alkylation response protein AidB-like acyl-CoA dehydrogenase